VLYVVEPLHASGAQTPLAAGGVQHLFGVNSELVKDQRELVDEGNADIARFIWSASYRQDIIRMLKMWTRFGAGC
jgi:hypothetical protein